ncbi:MAG TPA: hypothetical protein PLV72_00820 [Candidatus Magasanikbacteria bacterium]|nr:hypothetical protein [Candidatus Magasanikbacteria bacterium]
MNGVLYNASGNKVLGRVINGVVYRDGWFSQKVVGRIEGNILRDGVSSLQVLAVLNGPLVQQPGFIFLSEPFARIDGDIIYRGAGSGSEIVGRFRGPPEIALAIYFFM